MRWTTSVYFAIVEYARRDNPKIRSHRCLVTDTDHPQALAHMAGAFPGECVVKTFGINMTMLVAEVRADAKAAGLDFSAAFLPPPDHPAYAELFKPIHRRARRRDQTGASAHPGRPRTARQAHRRNHARDCRAVGGTIAVKFPRIISRAIGALFRRDSAGGFLGAGGGDRQPKGASLFAPARQQLMARHQLASRANWTAGNSPSGASAADVWTTSLVGDGPSVRSNHPNEGIRRALEDGWKRFYANCDQEGVHDLGGMLSGITRSMIVAGDGIFHFVTGPRAELRLRHLSPEQLDPSMTREIEDMAASSRASNFPPMAAASPITSIPNSPISSSTCFGHRSGFLAEDVVHIFDAKVPGQVRGISWLSPVLTPLMELDRLQDALLARANTAALFGGFITDPDNVTGLGEGPSDPQQVSLEPGVLRNIGTASITFPNMPSADDMPDLLRHLLRQIAAAGRHALRIARGRSFAKSITAARSLASKPSSAASTQFARPCSTRACCARSGADL